MAFASTFLGGDQYDQAYAIAVNSAGDIFVAGSTISTNFPTTGFGPGSLVYNDIFVAKLDKDLTTLSAAAFIGGNGADEGFALALDGNGDVFVTGYTTSTDFPTTIGAFKLSPVDQVHLPDIIISKLGPELNKLLASTYLGGTVPEKANSIAIDRSGNVFVAGDENDVNTYVARCTNTLNLCNARVIDIGSSTDLARAIAINSAGDVYLGGHYYVSDIYRGYIAKISNALTGTPTTITLGGSLPGNCVDSVEALTLDSSGNVYAAGTTSCNNFPVGSVIVYRLHSGDKDAFVAKLDGNLTTILASTYLGGSYRDEGQALAISSSGDVYVAGVTSNSTSFPYGWDFPTTLDAYDTTFNNSFLPGIDDGFISFFKSDLSQLKASTYLGGNNTDSANTLAVSPSGLVYVAGHTASTNFPSTTGAYDTSYHSNQDAFISRFPPNLSNSGDINLLLTVNASGPGLVESVPSGITCGSDCQQYYVPGTKVALIANPDAGALFEDWGPPCSGSGPCTVTMDANRTVTPSFRTADNLDVWHWRHPLPQGNRLRDVAFNNTNNTFVAVGDKGAIIRSTDSGETWSDVSLRLNQDLYGITFGNGLFVAVGSGGAILTSSDDGGTWISRLSFTGGELHDVASRNGLFVVVGANGTILTSSDGINWIQRTSGTTFDLYGVSWGNVNFVAVGSGGAILTSSDGTSWISRSSGTTNHLLAVGYGNGYFIAGGSNGTILKSLDGATWTQKTSGITQSIYGINYGSNSTFVAVTGVGATGSIRISTNNGESWTNKDNCTWLNYYGTFFGNGTYVIVGDYGLIWTTINTFSSLVQKSGNLLFSCYQTPSLADIAYNNNTFVAVGGANGKVLTSPDGSAWTVRNGNTVNSLSGIAFGNNSFVAVGGNGSISSSNDNGVSWDQRVSSITSHLNDVAFGNNLFVAVGAGGVILTSSDGTTWASRTAGTSDLQGIAFGNNLFVAVGASGTVLTSTNGIDWISQTSGVSYLLYSVAYGNGSYLAVGNFNGYLSSPTGSSWTSHSSPTAGAFTAAVFADGLFALASYTGLIYTSADSGATWIKRDTLNGNGFLGLAFGNNTLVGVGYGGAVLQSDPFPAAPQPDISVSPTSLPFGDVNVGSSSTQNLRITNNGTQNLVVSSVTIIGTDAGQFSIVVGSCGSLTPTILPSSNCEIGVTFSPTSTGAKTASLSISSNDPDTPLLDIPLTGTGLATDTQAPTIQITSPTTLSTYHTGLNSIDIAGTASDNVGVTQVSWTNNRGGSGTAGGTDNWGVNGITLYSGDNIITVTAWDAAANSTADTLTVTWEYISKPDPPTGPSNGVTGLTYTYTGSAVSNLSHTLQYRFDWGDDTQSEWGSSSQSKFWAGYGTYNVYVQARCQDHPTIVSEWSNYKTVTISYATLIDPLYPIITDTTWTLGNSPYVITGDSGLLVNTGATLTIEPGVVVKFLSGPFLWISGTLNAVGTNSLPIYFTSINDNSVGGNTGTGIPALGDWSNIGFQNGGTGRFEYCFIQYGGNPNQSLSFPLNGNTLTIRHSTIRYSAGRGIYIGNGNHLIQNSSVVDNTGPGIFYDNAAANINGSTFSRNGVGGIWLERAGSTGAIFNSIFSGPGQPYGIYSRLGANPIVGGEISRANTISGNTTAGVHNEDQTVTINATYNDWGTPSGPYHPGLNPSGTGNPVSSYVNFDPWIGKKHPLNVTKVGTGRIISLPSGIDYGGDPTEDFQAGSIVTLKAIPDSGTYFSGWSDGCTGKALTCLVTMNQARTVTATFTPGPPPVDNWAKKFDYTYNDYPRAIQQTSDGGYVVAGAAAAGDSGNTYNLRVLKLDGDGGITWHQSIDVTGDLGYSEAYSVQETADGGFILGGYREPGGAGGVPVGWILKLNSGGTVQWQYSVGGVGHERIFKVRQSSDGGYIAIGTTSYSFIPAIGRDALVIKLDLSGNVVWEKRYDLWNDDVFSIQETADRGFILAGTNLISEASGKRHLGHEAFPGWFYRLAKNL